MTAWRQSGARPRRSVGVCPSGRRAVGWGHLAEHPGDQAGVVEDAGAEEPGDRGLEPGQRLARFGFGHEQARLDLQDRAVEAGEDRPDTCSKKALSSASRPCPGQPQAEDQPRLTDLDQPGYRSAMSAPSTKVPIGRRPATVDRLRGDVEHGAGHPAAELGPAERGDVGPAVRLQPGPRSLSSVAAIG